MKVNVSEENRNQEFLDRYPDPAGHPHLYVVDQQGNFLHSQPTAVLEDGRSYDQKAMLSFLDKWAP